MLSRSSVILSVIIALTVAACGGGSGGSSGATTATGQFKDNNTSGLAYISGAQSGVTATDGSFTYEVGQPVTFKIGGVTVGSISAGKSTVTPLDLATAGTSATANVTNRVRFLMMLDSDGNPANGINISSAVQAAATLWSQPAFDTGDIASDAAMSAITSAVQSTTALTVTLPSAATAKSHVESTLRCIYAGAYKGTFSGGDSGQFGVLVDATNGNVSGVAVSSSAPGSPMLLTGVTPITYDQNAAFTSGNTSTGATFSGKYTSTNGVSGTWANTSTSSQGNFTGTRIGGSSNALYRYTGRFTGSDSGLFTFDFNASGNGTGVGYSVPTDTQFTLTGQLTGTSFTGTTSTGATLSATINTTAGTITGGSWSGTGVSGTFTGSGCKLN
jgi:hypothetical protein